MGLTSDIDKESMSVLELGPDEVDGNFLIFSYSTFRRERDAGAEEKDGIYKLYQIGYQ